MCNQNENSSNKKISWVSILNAVVQAIIAALTALGVSSCTSAINNLQLTVHSYDYDKGTISYDNRWGDGSQ